MEQQIQSYYAIIPATVRYDVRLPMGAKLLYGEITALCNARGFCWAENKYFARLYSADERTIRRWIENLVDYGYVIRNYIRGDKGNIEERCLSIPEPKAEIDKNDTDGVRTKMSGGMDKNVRGVRTKMSALYNKDEYLKMNITSSAHTRVGTVEESNLSDRLKEEVKRWLGYKTEQHKFTYKDKSLETLVRKVGEYEREYGTDNVAKIIEESIANGYKGICWERISKQPKKQEKTYKTEDLNKIFEGIGYDDL